MNPLRPLNNHKVWIGIVALLLLGVWNVPSKTSSTFERESVERTLASTAPAAPVVADTPRPRPKADSADLFSDFKSIFKENPIQIDLPTLRSSVVRFKTLNRKVSLAEDGLVSDAIVLPKETSLFVVADNACLERASMPVQDRATRPFARPKVNLGPGLPLLAYAVKLSADILVGHLRKHLTTEPCYIGVGQDGLFPISAATLQFATRDGGALQRQHSGGVMKTAESYDFFFDSTKGIDTTITFAVIDTGVDRNNPDLKPRMHSTLGYDFVDNDRDAMDQDWHGTFAAGMIAAVRDNDYGGYGVMSAFAKIVSVRACTETRGCVGSAIVNSINYATQNNIDVMSMSFAGVGSYPPLESAISNAATRGRAMVFAAGNENADAGQYFPARYGHKYATTVTVGAIDSVTRAKSSFSNFSSVAVSITAPGSNSICSTMPTSYTTNHDLVGCSAGTSFSTPEVAGALGLILAIYRSSGDNISASQAKTILLRHVPRDPALANAVEHGRYLDLLALARGIAADRPATLPALPRITTQPTSIDVNASTTSLTRSLAHSADPRATNVRWNVVRTGALVGTGTSISFNPVGVDGEPIRATVTNFTGSVMSVPITVRVRRAPVLARVTTPNPFVADEGSTVALSARLSAAYPAPTYRWERNGVAIAGATGLTLTISNIRVGALYRLVAENSVGSTAMDFSVSVRTRPIFTTQPPATVVVPLGKPLTLTVAASGYPEPTYRWLKNGAPIAGARAAVLTIASAVAATAGTYTAEATNVLGVTLSNASLVQTYGPPVITTQLPTSVTVNEGQVLRLSVVAQGTLLVYRWMRAGQVIAGATQATLSVPNIQRAAAGAYTVSVSNPAGSILSAGSNVQVQYAPEFTLSPVAVNGVLGGSAQFSGRAIAVPAPTYRWIQVRGGVRMILAGQTSSTLQIKTISYFQQGTYQLEATNAVGQAVSAAARLTLPSVVREPSARSLSLPASTDEVPLDRTGGFDEPGGAP